MQSLEWLKTSLFLGAHLLLVTGAMCAEPNLYRPLKTLPHGVKPRTKLAQTGPHQVAFSPDGQILAVAFENQGVTLFDLPAGDVRINIRHPDERGLTVAFSPDGKLLAHGGSGFWLWDCVKTTPIKWGEKYVYARSATFSPDGTMLVIGQDREQICVWNLELQGTVAKLDLFAGTQPDIDQGLYKPTVQSTAFSPDGKMLAVAVTLTDDELPTINHMQIWDLESHQLKMTFDGASGDFTPDGKAFVFLSQHQIKVRSTPRFIETATINAGDAELTFLALSRNGKTMAASDQKHAIHVFDLQSQKRIDILNGHLMWIGSLAISTDGTLVASSSADGTVRVWQRRQD